MRRVASYGPSWSLSAYSPGTSSVSSAPKPWARRTNRPSTAEISSASDGQVTISLASGSERDVDIRPRHLKEPSTGERRGVRRRRCHLIDPVLERHRAPLARRRGVTGRHLRRRAAADEDVALEARR